MSESTGAARLGELVEAVGADNVLTNPDSIETYRFDRAHAPNAGTPLAVVRPRTAEQVQAAVRWAAATNTPIVPRGAGTGLAGGASGVDDAITLSLERMTAIDIDPTTLTATVEAGALNGDVKRAAAEHGLHYPPDPSSHEISSIGGNVATNAGGLCCVKYGVTREYVLGLDVVLADGRLITVGGKRIKDVAGLSLVQLFVGSEGTLGIITEVVLRLVPTPPPSATLVATFPDLTAAADAVVGIRTTLRPSMLELLDHTTINAIEDYQSMGLDRSAGALLLAQSDAPGVARGLEIETMETVCRDNRASEVFSTTDPDEADMFLQARRASLPSLERLGALIIEDVGVPIPALPEIVTRVSAIAAKHELVIPVVAHAGDGNTHPLIVHTRGDADSERRAGLAFREIVDAALELGGTITGEHGVGRVKQPVLAAQLGKDVVEVTHRIKDALDPEGLLNPGAAI